MKYAVIESGGKQLKVEVGKSIWVEKLSVEEGKRFTFDKILSANDGTTNFIGTPFLNKSKVIGLVEKQGKAKKIIILRTKQKSNWKRKQGHRQPYTRLLIEEIVINNLTIDKKVQKKETKKVAKPKLTIPKEKIKKVAPTLENIANVEKVEAVKSKPTPKSTVKKETSSTTSTKSKQESTTKKETNNN